mgnify:CR=1 FL=1
MMDQSPGHHVLLTSPPQIFFLWRYVKDYVYQTPVQDLITHHRQIIEAVQTVDVDMLQHEWRQLEYCLYILRATGGAHVEVH